MRARVLVVSAAEVADTDREGSLGRSATTIWFSTESFTISSSKVVGWSEGMGSGVAVGVVLDEDGPGGKKRIIRGFFVCGLTSLVYTRMVAR